MDSEFVAADEALIARLQQAGLIPNGCSKWSLHIPVSGVIRLKVEIILTREQIVKLGKVFTECETSQP